jgi:hypothetical protein
MTEDSKQILLIITGSYDATTDFLLPQLPEEQVFRLNTDLFREYKIAFDAQGFTLADPAGRQIASSQVCKVWWRWPDWPITATEEERYVWSELRYLLREMVNLLWCEGKFVLVEPEALMRTGKLLQLTRAREYFLVPQFQAGLNLEYPAAEAPEVVKSLSRNLIGDKCVFTTVVDPSGLAPGFPWYRQRYVEAVRDVTVVVVRDRQFAFALERDFLDKSVDWREIPDRESAWMPIALSHAVCDAITKYMRDLHLDFGRLDFLMDASGDLHFCEVNPNPQFAWLDYEGKYGLLSAVLHELSPQTECHPIPAIHALAAK